MWIVTAQAAQSPETAVHRSYGVAQKNSKTTEDMSSNYSSVTGTIKILITVTVVLWRCAGMFYWYEMDIHIAWEESGVSYDTSTATHTTATNTTNRSSTAKSVRKNSVKGSLLEIGNNKDASTLPPIIVKRLQVSKDPIRHHSSGIPVAWTPEKKPLPL